MPHTVHTEKLTCSTVHTCWWPGAIWSKPKQSHWPNYNPCGQRKQRV